MPHIHLTILISALWSATSFSFLTGQVSLPCNILLCTQLPYSLPLTIHDSSLLVGSGINCLNFFHPIRILAIVKSKCAISADVRVCEREVDKEKQHNEHFADQVAHGSWMMWSVIFGKYAVFMVNLLRSAILVCSHRFCLLFWWITCFLLPLNLVMGKWSPPGCLESAAYVLWQI